jgi:membrane protein
VNISAIKDRIDGAQQRRRWLAFPFAVIKKFGADSSSNLAVLITYYAFFSIFPLLLALSSVLGFALHSHPGEASKIETNVLANFPLVSGPLPRHGSVIIIVVGTVLALYSGLGVAKTAQSAWDTVYGVPKGVQPGFVPKNLRALRLVVVGGVGLIVTTVVSGTATSASTTGLNLGPLATVLGIAIPVVLNALLFTVIFRWLTVRDVSFRDVLPGAALAAVALAILQVAASAFISHKLKGAKATYGSFGTVIVLLSWFYLQSQVLLLAAQLNVVKQDHLWPRSLNESPTDKDLPYEAPEYEADSPASRQTDPSAPAAASDRPSQGGRSSREALPVAGGLGIGFLLGRRGRRRGALGD